MTEFTNYEIPQLGLNKRLIYIIFVPFLYFLFYLFCKKIFILLFSFTPGRKRQTEPIEYE